MSILDDADGVYIERPFVNPDANMWDEMEDMCVSRKTVLVKCFAGPGGCHRCIEVHNLLMTCPVCGHFINTNEPARTFLCQCGTALTTCRPSGEPVICGVALPIAPEKEDII